MRTLSDELDVSLNISTLTGDYVVTQIYHNSIGVFSGHSYKGEADTITFNLNDIVSQNRGKDDYLKLNSNNELDCVPMRGLAFGVHTIYSRFDMGLIGQYRVWASDGTSNVQSDYEHILSGYDYENKDIRPSMIVDNYDTELCRIMQGCNWYDNSEDEIGNFYNLLIPRVPAVATKKFGIGLQLYHYNASGYNPTRYSIRATLGRDVSLGAVWGKSNQTFLRLSDLYWNGIAWPSNTDSSLFLKYELWSGDEFGDYDQRTNEYLGKCPIAIIEGCHSRYYLAWNDRYGDIMSLPFEGKIEFSEDTKTDEIMDYKERRRVTHKTVLPKWKLNTKWLNEDIYPMYEAIFTSPYLLLYDAEQDKAWNVIITDSEYKQKTHKTEKGLFNLEITVESNKTQEMTY